MADASALARLEPYRGLDFFSEADASMFFGRDRDRARIIANLRAARMTVLYAESGVGKSSLLRAGIAPRVRGMTARGNAPRYVPVVFSYWIDDPVLDLIAHVEASVRNVTTEEVELPRTTLRGAVELATSATDTTLLIMLDQFEELFQRTREAAQFADELAHCIRLPLRANFLIALREDAFARLGELFSAHGVDIDRNRLHIEALDREASRAAILGPLEYINASEPGAPITVEPALVDVVLDQLREDGPEARQERFSAPYLQLVMSRLWEVERAGGSNVLRLATLEALGGATTIVRGDVERALAELNEYEREVASALLRFLVTASGTKIALSIPELAEFAERTVFEVGTVVDLLTRARILRRVAPRAAEGEPRVEIFHDVLAPALLEWRQLERESRLIHGGALARLHRKRSARLVALVLIELAIIIVLGGLLLIG